jgi:hypothetical protein
MPRFTRYTCKPELLPTVEGVLAAHGHTIALLSHHAPDDTSDIVMTCGETFVLLARTGMDDRAEIEVWGPAQAATVQVLEAAPIELEKQPCDVPASPREREIARGDSLWDPTLGM